MSFNQIVEKVINEVITGQSIRNWSIISDFVHSIKLIWGNLVDDPDIIDTLSSVSISQSDFLNYDLGHTVFNKSKIGKIKNCYPLDLFSNEPIKHMKD